MGFQVDLEGMKNCRVHQLDGEKLHAAQVFAPFSDELLASLVDSGDARNCLERASLVADGTVPSFQEQFWEDMQAFPVGLADCGNSQSARGLHCRRNAFDFGAMGYEFSAAVDDFGALGNKAESVNLAACPEELTLVAKTRSK